VFLPISHLTPAFHTSTRCSQFHPYFVGLTKSQVIGLHKFN
jgi:hypothetical protein